MKKTKIYEHKQREIITDFEINKDNGSGFVQANEYEDGKFVIRVCLYRPYNSNDASQSMGDKPYEQNFSVDELRNIRDALSDFIVNFEERLT